MSLASIVSWTPPSVMGEASYQGGTGSCGGGGAQAAAERWEGDAGSPRAKVALFFEPSFFLPLFCPRILRGTAAPVAPAIDTYPYVWLGLRSRGLDLLVEPPSLPPLVPKDYK